MIAKKGDWVRIHSIVLTSSERAPQVPSDTASVPLEMWVKGFATHEASIGEEIEIETITGRKMVGNLDEVDPAYNHSFGNNMPELLQIGKQVRDILFGGEK